MQRPRGFGLLAKVVLLLGISGLGGLVLMPWGAPLMVAPQFLPLGEVATRWILFVATSLYCAASFVFAYALWRVRSFALRAYYAWFASVALHLAVWLFLIRIPKPWGVGVAFFGLLATFLYFAWRVVRPVLGSGANAL